VDIFVPTYNEDLNVVKNTIYASQGIDWPKDKLNIWILDDGGREEFRQFAKDVGVHYIARTTHEHAKAGNINNAETPKASSSRSLTATTCRRARSCR
jgi:cellulose synthase (UDP-forming)